MRPLEFGATYTVHSLTKYLAGHGDVLGGVVVAEREKLDTLQTLSRALGPVLGPFEAYLAMRGIKIVSRAHGAPVRQRLQSRELARNRIRTSTASTSPAIPRIPTPPSSNASSRRACTAPWSASK